MTVDNLVYLTLLTESDDLGLGDLELPTFLAPVVDAKRPLTGGFDRRRLNRLSRCIRYCDQDPKTHTRDSNRPRSHDVPPTVTSSNPIKQPGVIKESIGAKP